MTRARFLKGLEKLYPPGFENIATHVDNHIGKPLTDWVLGDPTGIIFHRGFTFSDDTGLLAEQSRSSVEAVFRVGGRNVEIDTTPLRGSRITNFTSEEILRAYRNIGLFHDMFFHRQFGRSGESEQLTWEDASLLRIGYEMFTNEGQPTGEFVYTQEAPLGLKEYWEEIQFCYRASTTIHDLRGRSPLEIITQLIAIIESDLYPGAEAFITKHNVFQVYALAFPGGGRELAQLLDSILQDLGIQFDLKRIQIIPAISAPTIQQLSRGQVPIGFTQKFETCAGFLESFLEHFTVPAFNVCTRMLDKYVNATTHELQVDHIRQDFPGTITPFVEEVLRDDHLFHKLKTDMRAKHGVPIVATNKAGVTSWGSETYLHWYRSQNAELMDPSQDIIHFAFSQQSLVTTSIESGFDFIMTDYPQEALAALAFKQNNKGLSERLLGQLSRTLVSQEQLHALLEYAGGLKKLHG